MTLRYPRTSGGPVEDPTIEFGLITFLDLSTATYSTSQIPDSMLWDRILFARTSEGNYAKLQVRCGDDLVITRLKVYSPDGCMLLSASNLVIPRSSWCNLDTAREQSTGADFQWHRVWPGERHLHPANGAAFHLYRAFPSVTFDEVRNADYVTRLIPREALTNQVIFCRTNQGRYAKLHVSAGNTLHVKQLVVFEAAGQVQVRYSNIDVPPSHELDVDTGRVAPTGGDLRWEPETETRPLLAPMNGAALAYPSYFRMYKYEPLLRTPAIRAAISFHGAGGTRAFDAWSYDERAHLHEFLYVLETGRDLPIPGPPPLIDEWYIKPCDAWKIYLAHVAQSLWVEANRCVPWRIQSSTPGYLAHLFDSTKLMKYDDGRYRFAGDAMGLVTHWSPSISYRFLQRTGLIQRDPWSTIQAVADWCRANLVHIADYRSEGDGGPFESPGDQYEYLYGYRGLPPVDKIIDPLPGRKHVTHGCWGTDGLLAAVLRTVNIPVRHGRTNLSGSSHSRPEFFSVGKYLAHGDDPYFGWVRLGHNNVPIARIFYDAATLAAEIDSPAPLPGKTVAETASFNYEKRFVALAVEFKTEYLLRMRCDDLTTGATGEASRLWQALRAYYTDAEIAAIAAQCDAAIAAIPGGCAAIAAV